MRKILELLEISKGLYIVPDEISEVTIIETEQFGKHHFGHTLVTLKNGNHYVAPLSPLDLFNNWVKSAEKSGFDGVDIYSVYEADKSDTGMKK